MGDLARSNRGKAHHAVQTVVDRFARVFHAAIRLAGRLTQSGRNVLDRRLPDVLVLAAFGVAVLGLAIEATRLWYVVANRRGQSRDTTAVGLDPEVIKAARVIARRTIDTESARSGVY